MLTGLLDVRTPPAKQAVITAINLLGTAFARNCQEVKQSELLQLWAWGSLTERLMASQGKQSLKQEQVDHLFR